MKRKLVCFVLVMSLILMIFAFVAPNGYASSISVHQYTSVKSKAVTPNASGGGCRTYSGSGVTVKSCINDSYPTVNSDGYITIGSKVNLNNCGVQLYLYDTNGDLIQYGLYGCVRGSSIHYGPVSQDEYFGGSFQTSLIVVLGSTSIGGQSPVQNA